MTALAAFRTWLAALGAALALLTGGCAVQWVSTFDRDAVVRIDEIARTSLGVYQDLLARPPAARPAAVAGPLAPRYGEVETLMRLHLLRERARTKNAGSIRIAENLLAAWQNFARHQRGGAADALATAVLEVQRMELERHLAAAYEGEEAKKLGGGTR